MRSSFVSEARLPTRLRQCWEGIPIFTSAVVIFCGTIYLACVLVGYDTFAEVCFSPSLIISHFQAYRIYTSILFHGSLLHILFNMLALIPLGSELERIMGSVRLWCTTALLATTNAVFHLLIALLLAHNPIHPSEYFMDECAIGFSGILFSMIVIETSLSGEQFKSVFGLLNVPAKWYVWILLVVFQLLMTNVSLLGHLCGILSGFAYTYGLFNILIPGTSFFSAIESSPYLSTFVRRPKFILSTGGNSGYRQTHSGQSISSLSSEGGLLSINLWRNISLWITQRETSVQSTQSSSQFPGSGRTLGYSEGQMVPSANSHSTLQDNLLDNGSSLNHTFDRTALIVRQQTTDGRHLAAGHAANAVSIQDKQGLVMPEELIQKLVGMGFERTQVEVATAASDGDLNVAVEILTSQRQQEG